MRAAVVQMNSDSDGRLEPRPRRDARPRRRRRWRRAHRPAREMGAPRPGRGDRRTEPSHWTGRSSAPPAGWARELGVHLCAGSVPEDPGDGGKPYNTSVLIDPDGKVAATYRKLHMFDVEVEGTEYRESEHERAGGRSRNGYRGRARAGHDRVLRPPLSRALSHPRPARRHCVHGPRGVHRRYRARALGAPPAGPRGRERRVRDRRRAGRQGRAALRVVGPLDGRSIRGAGSSRRSTTARATRAPTSTSPSSSGSASRCPRSRTAAADAYEWPVEAPV